MVVVFFFDAATAVPTVATAAAPPTAAFTPPRVFERTLKRLEDDEDGANDWSDRSCACCFSFAMAELRLTDFLIGTRRELVLVLELVDDPTSFDASAFGSTTVASLSWLALLLLTTDGRRIRRLTAEKCFFFNGWSLWRKLSKRKKYLRKISSEKFLLEKFLSQKNLSENW